LSVENVQTKPFEVLLREELYELEKFLIEKNTSYGNSALEPIRIFSKTNAIEQLNVRIDDKLNRIMQGKEYLGDDTEKDLIGYLILKRLARKDERV